MRKNLRFCKRFLVGVGASGKMTQVVETSKKKQDEVTPPPSIQLAEFLLRNSNWSISTGRSKSLERLDLRGKSSTLPQTNRHSTWKWKGLKMIKTLQNGSSFQGAFAVSFRVCISFVIFSGLDLGNTSCSIVLHLIWGPAKTPGFGCL